MADQSCGDLIFGGYEDALKALGYKDARAFKQFEKRYKDIIAKHGIEQALKMAEVEVKQRRILAADRKRAAVFNAAARESERARLKTKWAHNPYKGLIALLNGTAEDTDSIFNGQRGLAGNYIEGLQHDLVASGQWKTLQKRLQTDAAFDTAISEARIRLNEGRETTGLPKDAVHIAQIFKKWDDVSREKYNAVGGRIGKLDSRGQPIDHNSSRVMNASENVPNGVRAPAKDRTANYKAWADYVLSNLDQETTFADFIHLRQVEPEEYAARASRFLKTTWESITTDVHMANPAQDGTRYANNEGTRLAHSKVLHWKSASAGADYNRRFGHGTQLDAYVRLLDRRARSTAIMERLGPSARTTLDGLWDDAKKIAEDNHIERGKFKSRSEIDRIYDNIDGSANSVSNAMAASLFGGIRSFQSMTRLWGVTISSISDLGYRGRDAAFAGVPLLQRWSSYFDTFRRMERADRERLASAIGVGLSVRTGDFARRWAGDSFDGRMGRLAHIHANMNLLTHWTDGGRLAHAQMMATWLHEHRNMAHEALPAALRDDLERHGIGAKEWETIVEAAEDEVEGHKFFSPDKIAEADLGVFRLLADTDGMEEATANRVLGKAKNDLTRKLRTYYVDHAYAGVIEPDARTKAFFNRGLQRGDIVRESVATLFQFWTFPSQVLAGPFMRSLTSGNPMWNMTALLMSTAFWGFVSYNLKQFARGRMPRIPEVEEYPRYFAHMLEQGGGIGVLGSFLWSTALDEHGRDVQDVITGPTVQDATGVTRVLNKVAHGDMKGAGKDFANQVLLHAPNTFYTKAVWELYIASFIRESLEPGWQNKLENQTEGRTGDKTLLRTYQRVPRGGINAR